MSAIRLLAEVVFRHSDQFLYSTLRDFKAAEELTVELVRDTLVTLAEPEQNQIIQLITRLGNWSDFFQELCGHTLFSEDFDEQSFYRLWERISGFDVDGLIDIGDPKAISQRQNSEYLAKHELGYLFNGSGDLVETLMNEHVHYGQMGDTNLLWLAQIGSEGCRLGNVFDNGDTDSGLGAFSRRLEQLNAGDLPLDDSITKELTLTNRYNGAVEGRTKRLTWDTNHAVCKLLMAVSDWPEAVQVILRERLGPEKVVQLEALYSGDLLMLERLSLIERLVLERRILSWIHTESSGTNDRHELAVAYVLAKNCAFDRVCSNSVQSFEAFSRSLSVLDHIYARDAKVFDSITTISLFRTNSLRSRSLPAEVRYRLSCGLLKQKTFSHNFAAHLEMLRSLTRTREPKVTLSFSRNDFEQYSVEDLDALAERILDDYQEWGIELCGFDVIGPEARSSQASPDRSIGGTSDRLLLAPVDYVFELRARVERELSTPQRFLTFHLGEHVFNYEVGVMAVLSVLADSRFRPSLDRVSHGLILHEPVDHSQTSDRETQDVIGAIVSRLRNRLGTWDNGIFTDQEENSILGILDNYQSSSESSLLQPIQKLVRSKIEKGIVQLEVCPYSNRMIRGIPPASHLWATAYSSVKILVGTDDPSLTQTLPWMEHSALRS